MKVVNSVFISETDTDTVSSPRQRPLRPEEEGDGGVSHPVVTSSFSARLLSDLTSTPLLSVSLRSSLICSAAVCFVYPLLAHFSSLISRLFIQLEADWSPEKKEKAEGESEVTNRLR